MHLKTVGLPVGLPAVFYLCLCYSSLISQNGENHMLA